MNIIKRRQKIIEDLRNKEYRDAFVAEHINTGIPFQIRALREQKGRGWSQKGLGIRTRMAQETISRIEDPNYGKLTLKTLKRLASVFDIGLMVRFVPFGELVKWELSLTSESLEASSFDKDPYFEATGEEIASSSKETITADHEQYIAMIGEGTSCVDNVTFIRDCLRRRSGQPPQNASVSVASCG